jgi:hypothetical protein
MRYCAMPTLSVDAVHAKLICVPPAAVADKLEGTVGGIVSGTGVVAVAVLE